MAFGPNLLSADDATMNASIGHWVLPAGASGQTLTRVTTPTPHAGAGALDVRSGSPGIGTDLFPILPDVLAVTPGQMVKWSIWLRADAVNAGNSYFMGMQGSNAYGDIHTITDSAWTQFHNIGVAQSGVSFMGIESGSGMSGGGSHVYFSDASIQYDDLHAPSDLAAYYAGGTHIGFTWTPPDNLPTELDDDVRAYVDVSFDGGSTWPVIGIQVSFFGYYDFSDYACEAGTMTFRLYYKLFDAAVSLFVFPTPYASGLVTIPIPPCPPTPADADEYCLTTPHSYQGVIPAGDLYARALAFSPSSRYLYVGSNGATIARIDTTDWSYVNPWVTVDTSLPFPFDIFGFCADSAGNLYATMSNNTINKIDPSGTVTAAWASLPSGWQFNVGLSLGTDDKLYCACIESATGRYTVFRIDLSGTVTELLDLRTPVAVTSVGYDYATALSDGTVWVSLDPPQVGSDYGVNVMLRRYRSPSSFVEDKTYVIGPPGVPRLNSLPNVIAGDCLVFIGNANPVGSPTVPAVPAPETTGWEVALDNPGVLGGRDGITVWFKFSDGVEPATYPVDTWGVLLAYRGIATTDTVLAAVCYEDHDVSIAPPITTSLPNALVLRIYNWNNISGGVAFTCDGYRTVYYDIFNNNNQMTVCDNAIVDAFSAPTGSLAPTPSGPQGSPGWSPFCSPGVSGTASSTSIALAPADPSVPPTLVGSGVAADIADIAIQQLVDRFDGYTEIFGGLFVDDNDHLIIPLITYGPTPTRSWFLRVAPDGTATRIAGDWRGGTPTNIADGPLGTGLAAVDDESAGMSPDRRTLYFLDSSGGDYGNADLVRAVGPCAPTSAPPGLTWGPVN